MFKIWIFRRKWKDYVCTCRTNQKYRTVVKYHFESWCISQMRVNSIHNSSHVKVLKHVCVWRNNLSHYFHYDFYDIGNFTRSINIIIIFTFSCNTWMLLFLLLLLSLLFTILHIFDDLLILSNCYNDVWENSILVTSYCLSVYYTIVRLATHISVF